MFETTGASRIWVVAAPGLLVAWSRIYLGVHFPLDVLGPALAAILCAAPAGLIQPVVER